jgi:23S rRNA (pseudouridine1915-N3)-methyltransferase
VLAIGGADGHTDALRKRAKKSIAFGRLTIAHRLVRILVLEQLYRAFKINRGEPYHRD